MGRKSAKASDGLGRAVINARENLPAAKRKRHKLKIGEEDINKTVISNTDEKNRQIQSITEQNDLDDFLTKAQLAGTEFTAQRTNLSLIDSEPNKLIGSLSAVQNQKTMSAYQETYGHLLKIPRRPAWGKGMTVEQLQKAETEAFLSWRRQLAELEENEKVVLTPFERNIEIWRQLWRVIERSHVVVQILDSRDPLLFRNEDLEDYVKDLDSRKINVLLLNKADFLTEKQREIWCRYFNEQNIRVVFWSAIDLLDNGGIARRLEHLNVNESEDEKIEDRDVEKESERSRTSELDDGTPTNPRQIELVETQGNDDAGRKSELNRPDLMTKDELVLYFKSLRSSVGLGRDDLLTIGMVGYPNVGKSSTINKLMCRKKVAVSATPGKTKHFQTLYLEPNLMLCDCPGLVMPSLAMSKAQMLLSGILAADQMRQHESVIELLCTLLPRFVFERAYGLTFPAYDASRDSATCAAVKPADLLTLHAFVRGFMSTKGLPDCSRAARAIVKDFVNGKLKFRHAPPTIDQASFETFDDWLKPVKKDQSEHRKVLLTNSTDQSAHANEGELFASRADQSGKGVLSETLITVQKRHLLADDDQSLSRQVDGTFFGKNLSQAHVTSKKPAAVSQPTDGKPPKKLNRNKKKDKLRRIYKHLDA